VRSASRLETKDIVSKLAKRPDGKHSRAFSLSPVWYGHRRGFPYFKPWGWLRFALKSRGDRLREWPVAYKERNYVDGPKTGQKHLVVPYIENLEVLPSTIWTDHVKQVLKNLFEDPQAQNLANAKPKPTPTKDNFKHTCA